LCQRIDLGALADLARRETASYVGQRSGSAAREVLIPALVTTLDLCCFLEFWVLSTLIELTQSSSVESILSLSSLRRLARGTRRDHVTVAQARDPARFNLELLHTTGISWNNE
jgi:hypothetical protein